MKPEMDKFIEYLDEKSPVKIQQLKEDARAAELTAITVIKDLEGPNKENIKKETGIIFDKTAELLKKYGRIEDIPAFLTMGNSKRHYYKYLEWTIGDSCVFVETSPPRQSEEIIEKRLKEKSEIILLRIHNKGKIFPKIKFAINSKEIHICRSSEDNKEKQTYKKANEVELDGLGKIIDSLSLGKNYQDNLLDIIA